MKRLLLALALAAAQFAAQGQAVPNPKATGIASGGGSVTSAACSPANGVTCSVTNATTTPTFAIGLGAITPTSVNGLVVSTTTGTLTVANAKTLAASNTLTLAGTDATTMTFPTTSATLARTDAGNTFTGHQTIEGITSTGATGSGLLVFGTSPALTTPNIGAATATSVNGLAISTSTGTLTVANAKTLTVSNTLTLAGTDSKTFTLPTLNALALPYVGSGSWSTITSTFAASTYSGYQAFVTDLGTNGSMTRSNGTRYLPLNGTTRLKSVTAVPVAGTTETIVMQTQIPAGYLVTTDDLRFWLQLVKSGTTDTGTINIRVGTAGTTSDTVVSTASVFGAANRSQTGIVDISIASATTMTRMGPPMLSTIGAQNTNAAATPVTISNVSNSLFITVTIASGTTDTITLQQGFIDLLTQ